MNTVTQSTVFDRVLCGVDNSDAGLTAATVAARLAAPAGALTLLSANDESIAVHAGSRMPQLLAELAADASSALERGAAAAEPFHRFETRIVKGDPLHALLAEITRQDATLVVVGTHGHSRATGIALGAVSSYLLHEAPCSVAIARRARDTERWPRTIVVGIDGSPDSAAAFEAARTLAERLDASVRTVVATIDPRVDLEAALRIAPECEQHEAGALDTLAVASEKADLIVVGGRGLRGIQALGSLSERIAHEALCSVLVVRASA
jgi:nucleotide-binding universal stress UspA family protein